MKEKNITASKKLYNAILTGCLIAIVGISAIVYNFSAPKNAMQNNNTSSKALTSYSRITTAEQDEEANVPATGIPKPTVVTTTETTVSEDEKPYKGSFVPPTSGKVIKEFSEGEMVKSETMGDWRVHNGADFTAAEGETVSAVQNCTVVNVDKDEMWGVTVTVLCPGELYVRYCGLADSVSVKKGDRIAKGGTIGKAGTLPIESALEPHVHVETSVGGEVVNPLEVLNLM